MVAMVEAAAFICRMHAQRTLHSFCNGTDIHALNKKLLVQLGLLYFKLLGKSLGCVCLFCHRSLAQGIFVSSGPGMQICTWIAVIMLKMCSNPVFCV